MGCVKVLCHTQMTTTKNTMLSSSISTLYANEDQKNLEKARTLFENKEYAGSLYLYEKLESRAKRPGLILSLIEKIDDILSMTTYMPIEYREKLFELKMALKVKQDQIRIKEMLTDVKLNKTPERPTDSEDEVCAENGAIDETMYHKGGRLP